MTTTIVSNDGDIAIAGYVAATNSMRVDIIDPLDQKYLPGILANVTDGTDGTYYYTVDMSGFSKASWQFVLDCDAGTVTCTLEISNLDDGTDPGSIAAAEWTDATNDFFGVASLVATAAPATDYWVENTGAVGLCKWARIKVVAATTGGDTGDWKITCKRAFH